MMEQRNQMLRELRLNKKESLGIVSKPGLIVDSAMCVCCIYNCVFIAQGVVIGGFQ